MLWGLSYFELINYFYFYFLLNIMKNISADFKGLRTVELG